MIHQSTAFADCQAALAAASRISRISSDKGWPSAARSQAAAIASCRKARAERIAAIASPTKACTRCDWAASGAELTAAWMLPFAFWGAFRGQVLGTAHYDESRAAAG
jgi:hypothetical protein